MHREVFVLVFHHIWQTTNTQTMKNGKSWGFTTLDDCSSLYQSLYTQSTICLALKQSFMSPGNTDLLEKSVVDLSVTSILPSTFQVERWVYGRCWITDSHLPLTILTWIKPQKYEYRYRTYGIREKGICVSYSRWFENHHHVKFIHMLLTADFIQTSQNVPTQSGENRWIRNM